MTRQLHDRLLKYGPNHLRLLVRVMRELAHRRPLPAAQVDGFIANLGIAPDEARQFLRQVTERDASDQVIGALGLSLQDQPHRVSVDGIALSAWCAEDTLFLPAILQQTATIKSPSPVSGQPIRLRVSPERVEEVSSAGAVGRGTAISTWQRIGSGAASRPTPTTPASKRAKRFRRPWSGRPEGAAESAGQDQGGTSCAPPRQRITPSSLPCMSRP